MDETFCQLTVYFDQPFWVGVFERVIGNKLTVCKITFGSEPKSFEVYDFILKNYYKLEFSPIIETTLRKTAANPKRIQRNAKKIQQSQGIGTKSQQALQLQREQLKTERKTIGKEQKELEEKRLYELKQKKKKEKHRGK